MYTYLCRERERYYHIMVIEGSAGERTLAKTGRTAYIYMYIYIYIYIFIYLFMKLLNYVCTYIVVCICMIMRSHLLEPASRHVASHARGLGLAKLGSLAVATSPFPPSTYEAP